MNLFIDTNIFLTFYHLTSEDLEELRKLIVLLRAGQVQLLLPEQVKTEFERNRENKIADAIKGLRGQHLKLQFPALCRDYAEFSKLRELQRLYEEEHASLLNKIRFDVSARSLKADLILKELFAGAKTIATTADIINRARSRHEVGNPPGKKSSIGDAVNWESLVAEAPFAQPLYFITGDDDYTSALNWGEDTFDPFLMDEWLQVKGSQLFYYKRLSHFFKNHFPSIKLASELETEMLVQSLQRSGTFARTHELIGQLAKISNFTIDQTLAILFAASLNDQVRLIINDDDIKDFITRIIAARKGEIEPLLLNTFAHLTEQSVEN